MHVNLLILLQIKPYTGIYVSLFCLRFGGTYIICSPTEIQTIFSCFYLLRVKKDHSELVETTVVSGYSPGLLSVDELLRREEGSTGKLLTSMCMSSVALYAKQLDVWLER